MSVQERREREKGELRQKILTAVADVIAESGHEQLTIREVARRIEYSPRTIYLYFRNKEHLMQEVAEEGFRATIRGRAEQTMPLDMDPVLLVEGRIRAHIAMAFSRPNLYRAIIAVVTQRNHQPGDAESIIIKQTRDDIRRLVGPREMTEEEVVALSDVLFTFIRSVTLLLLNRAADMTESERARYIDAFVRFSISGIRGT